MKITPQTIHETMNQVVVGYHLEGDDTELVADGEGFVEIPDEATGQLRVMYTRNAGQTQQVVIELGTVA
jgi:hypothetical protein